MNGYKRITIPSVSFSRSLALSNISDVIEIIMEQLIWDYNNRELVCKLTNVINNTVKRLYI